jgi:SpoVK/Ycf46/Vps4 family AAA+-type ATPase
MFMAIQMADSEAMWFYNGFVVAEPTDLATAMDQYWFGRRTLYEQILERSERAASNTSAEQDWKSFCLRRTGFISNFLADATASISSELRELWQCSYALAREAQKAFEENALAELWIPFSRRPLKFVRVAPRTANYDIRETATFDEAHSFELGKPYIAILWKGECLFLLLPSAAYVTMSTFTFTKDGSTWNSGDVIPDVFSNALTRYQSDLSKIIPRFDALSEHWYAKNLVAATTSRLRSLPGSAIAWQKVRLPENQKLAILRRMELFERADPAAPRGLLRQGPPGTGKSLLARTIATTVGCDFQNLSLADLKHEHLGASGRRVREIWARARANTPAIIFVDECDAVFGRRGAAETDVVATEVVSAFLPEWDGLEHTPGVMVIGATNKRDMLDDAIISRFGWEMEVPLPAALERRQILEQELLANHVEIDLPGNIDSFTQGMSGRDLRNLAATTRSLAHPGKPTLTHLQEAIASSRRGEKATPQQTTTWQDLALEPSILERLQLTSALLRDSQRWREQGVQIPRSLLLTGSDGGTKQQLAQALSNETGISLFAPTLADFKAGHTGQSGNRVKLFFERARVKSPAIIFLDRLDTVAPSRVLANAADAFNNEIIGQLAQEWERVRNSDSCIFLLGATNSPDLVDQEILDCFQETLVVEPPSRNARIKLFTRLLANKKIAFSLDDGAILLAELGEGMNLDSRDIENSVNTAQQRALLRAVRNGGPEHYSITLDDFDSVDRAER